MCITQECLLQVRAKVFDYIENKKLITMKPDLKEYKKISTIIFLSFFINMVFILVLNYSRFENVIVMNFGRISAEIIRQFFYGAIGATISCSIFLKKDKEMNELESLKDNPDPTILRLPDIIDKRLYIQRIITSGILAILGTLLILAGYSYLEVDFSTDFTFKHKLFFAISSLLIGIYQSKFLNSVEKIFEGLFKSNKSKGKE